jgi:hypothetical protein
MCCDNLVCAGCSRPVAEAACSVCRAAQASFHRTQPVPMAVFAAILTALLLLAVVLSLHG